MSYLEPERLRAALALHPWVKHPALPGRHNSLRAGVLVPLRWAPEPEVILIERSLELPRHAGEVAFPGGRPEASDPDLLATAVREAREELGIDEPRILGRLASMPVYTSEYRLEPFVAEVRQPQLTPDPGEVARVLISPLRTWLERGHLDCLVFEREGEVYRSPVFEVGGAVMFGASAHTFLELLEVCAAARQQEVPPLEPGRFRWEDLVPAAAGLEG